MLRNYYVIASEFIMLQTEYLQKYYFHMQPYLNSRSYYFENLIHFGTKMIHLMNFENFRFWIDVGSLACILGDGHGLG